MYVFLCRAQATNAHWEDEGRASVHIRLVVINQTCLACFRPVRHKVTSRQQTLFRMHLARRTATSEHRHNFKPPSRSRSGVNDPLPYPWPTKFLAGRICGMLDPSRRIFPTPARAQGSVQAAMH